MNTEKQLNVVIKAAGKEEIKDMDTRDNAKYQEYLKSDKWQRIAEQRMEIDGNACVMCGSRGTTANPLEVHHLSYKWLYHEENRIYEDLCTLCHSCHKQVHNLMCRKTAPNRNGWRDRYDIPRISVYTLTGETIASKEVGKV